MQFDNVYLPSGQAAKLNKLEQLYLIAKDHSLENDLLFCVLGKPSAPIYQPIIDAEIEYWSNTATNRAIEYGELQGEIEYRSRMASALSNIYNVNFTANDVIFTTGGRIGIQAISYMLRTLYPNKKVVTTSYYYPDHTGLSYSNDFQHHMLYVDVNDFSGLTAESLVNALKDKAEDEIGGFIFCDPNNPLGNVVGFEEWKKIIPVLQQYPEIPIVLDEAYAEMVFDKGHESLVSIAPDDILNRLILLRSATKGFSVSGERMAVLVTKNRQFMNSIVEYHASNMVHTPKSSQNAYTYAMESFDESSAIKLADYYKKFVRSVEKDLKESDFNIKNENYGPRDATFYVISDFSEFLGKEMNPNALKYFVRKDKKIIENNIDLAVHFIFEYNLAIMPLYFFGGSYHSGLLRITCSFDSDSKCQEIGQVFKKMRQDLENYSNDVTSDDLVSSLTEQTV